MSSKIKVDTIENVAGSGNVSLGSGHNLVVPGNITGSGDLTVDTSTLKVNASTNRVGIGTTSPNNPLEISHTGSAGAGGLRIGDPSTIASDTGIYLRTTGDAVIGAAGGNIVFDTNMAVQEDMRINSNGQITTPRQPAFSIGGGPNSYRDSGGNETVVLHGQSGAYVGDMNIGGHFSYSNGRFTAPVAGNYMFTYTLSSGDTNSHFIELRKNNASQNTILLYTTIYQSGCHSAIMTLAANDYVTAQRRGTSYGVYSAIFSGFLIG